MKQYYSQTTIQNKDGLPIVRVYHPETKEVVIVTRPSQNEREKCKHTWAAPVYPGPRQYTQACTLCGTLRK